MADSIPPVVRIGRNIHTMYGFASSADHALETGANVFQIFLKSPHSHYSRRRSIIELKQLKSRIDENNQIVLIHGSFMLNFCHPVWSELHISAVTNLVNDLNDSIILGAMGVVIHMGHNTCQLDEKQAIANYVQGIKTSLSKSHPKSIIILETGAGQGHEICTSLFDLGSLRNSFNDQDKSRLKFCLDTCHMYAAGYDIANPIYNIMLDKLIETTLGWSNIVAIHLNDSDKPLNCRKDKHADIGKGHIGAGLIDFAKLCISHHIPIVLETPCNSTKNSERYTHKKQIEFIRHSLRLPQLPIPVKIRSYVDKATI